jgi:hypothetical protein
MGWAKVNVRLLEGNHKAVHTELNALKRKTRVHTKKLAERG